MSLTFLGLIGATLILVAFILNQIHIWKEDYLIYDTVNLGGSAILVAYGLLIGAYPFVILNSVWAIFSLRDIIIDIFRNEHRKSRGFYNKWLK